MKTELQMKIYKETEDIIKLKTLLLGSTHKKSYDLKNSLKEKNKKLDFLKNINKIIK